MWPEPTSPIRRWNVTTPFPQAPCQVPVTGLASSRYTWSPFRHKFMGHGLVGIGRMTRLLYSQAHVDREEGKRWQRVIYISKAHLPILALLSFTHYYPPTFPGFHHPCHCNTILFSYSVPRPFLPSIAGSPITIALSHLAFSQVEAACVRDYHTFVWSSVPESATDGSPVHASVQFQGTRGDRELGGRSQGG